MHDFLSTKANVISPFIAQTVKAGSPSGSSMLIAEDYGKVSVGTREYQCRPPLQPMDFDDDVDEIEHIKNRHPSGADNESGRDAVHCDGPVAIEDGDENEKQQQKRKRQSGSGLSNPSDEACKANRIPTSSRSSGEMSKISVLKEMEASTKFFQESHLNTIKKALDVLEKDCTLRGREIESIEKISKMKEEEIHIKKI